MIEFIKGENRANGTNMLSIKYGKDVIILYEEEIKELKKVLSSFQKV